ncbi:MAG: NAD-dependent deacylase [Rhodothermales bacterium]
MPFPFSQTLLERLQAAKRVAVLTGAGVSAESGVATFRDAQTGLYANHRPEDLASEAGFRANPKLVQGWYRERRQRVHEVEPNPGHHALVQLADQLPHLSIATQNVDGLHQRAGSAAVQELHGSIVDVYCIACGGRDQATVTNDGLERCAHCQDLMRPGVVWFGEMLPDAAWQVAEHDAIHADVYFSIGTSAVVYPAAGLPLIAKANGAYVVEINIAPSAIADDLDEVLLGPSGEVLPALLEALNHQHASTESRAHASTH